MREDDVPPMIRKLAEFVHSKALIGIERNQEIEPLLLLFTKEEAAENGVSKKVGLIPLDNYMNSPQGKDFIRYLMIDTVKQENIDVVIMVAEAWLAVMPADSVTKDEARHIKISERPDRQEVVILNIMTKTNQYLGTSKIIREPSPTLEDLDIFSVSDEDPMEGRLVRGKDDTPKVH